MRDVVLLLLYFLVITPYGVLRRRFGDPLARRWSPDAQSYFVGTERAA